MYTLAPFKVATESVKGQQLQPPAQTPLQLRQGRPKEAVVQSTLKLKVEEHHMQSHYGSRRRMRHLRPSILDRTLHPLWQCGTGCAPR